MKAAAAARAWWAALRRRSRTVARASARVGATSHIASFALCGLACVVLAVVVAGFVVTLHEDRRLETERHAALELALDEFHGMFGDIDHFNDAQLRLMERHSGLKDLRFDTDGIGNPGR